MKTIMLLGSGELGKEFVIACQRYGQHVIAVDRYKCAPAMQVADKCEVIDMLNGDELDRIVAKHKPDIIVPEIEAIRTERFFDYEKQGIHVVPSAKAANYTMNRKKIRDLAAKELGVKTAKYAYASSLEELQSAIKDIGLPCVIKPIMSSSGKGQSVAKTTEDIEKSWNYACEGSRGDIMEVIVEEFINFHTEITLLTVTQQQGETLYCAPIGHRQERGDYQESWQPSKINEDQLKQAQDIASKVTKGLTGAGIWGVEFFLGETEVWFSELSPRPHDTGMVTLAGTQNLNEFELHARAVLGYPIPAIELHKAGVSAVVLAQEESQNKPSITGVEEALSLEKTDVRVFGKPSTRQYRRMAVSLVYDELDADMDELRKKAKEQADKIRVHTT